MKLRKTLTLSVVLFASCAFLPSCGNQQEQILDIVKDNVELYEGENYKIELDELNLTEEVIFTSSNESVASVSYDGLITAHKEGEAYIEVKSSILSDRLLVTVKKAIELDDFEISITNSLLKIGEEALLEVNVTPSSYLEDVEFEILEGKDLVEIKNRRVKALKSGYVTIVGKLGNNVSNELKINTYDFGCMVLDHEIYEDTTFEARTDLDDSELTSNSVTVEIEDESIAEYTGTQYGTLLFKALKAGTTSFVVKLADGRQSYSVEFTVLKDNTYENVDKDEFYQNYKRANDVSDAKSRTEYYLMSGDISEQDQEPTIANNQPTTNGKFHKNSKIIFDSYLGEYTVFDYKGDFAFQVFRDGAYVTLEDVAAYVYAFGDVPPNYYEDRKNYPKPYETPWGEYLRLNNSLFSGDTNKYKYEPELPRISGNGGDLVYYEIDIGTTGTDCDPGYDIGDYNDGHSINRGAARIVYSARYTNGNPITDFDDRYVFYTYNHYNDFQEYLNYENGWGKMFGNITGGSTLNHYDRNNPPTEYPEVVSEYF